MLRSLGDPSGADEGLWEEACPLGTEGPVLCVTGRCCVSQQIFNLTFSEAELGSLGEAR